MTSQVGEGSKSPAEAESTPILSGRELGDKLNSMTMEDYLADLKAQDIHPEKDLQGIFIGAAFVPVGSSVNPRFGLTLKSYDNSTITLEDKDRQEHQILVR